MSLKSLQVFVTTDNKQFNDRAEAEAHQSMLDNAEVVAKVADSYCNVTTAPGAKEVGLVGRTRVFNKNVAGSVVAFLISKGLVDKEALELFEPIEMSEELAARMEAEAAKDAEKAAAKAAKDAAKGEGEGKGEGEEPVADANADADLFK